MSEDQWKYKYQAKVVSGYDGDTITLLVDCGLGTFRQEKFRLNRINAPELKGPERAKGLAARDYLHAMVPVGSKIEIQTIKDTQDKDKQEKYGRYLVEIYTDKGNINDLLVHAGFAEYRTY